MMYLVEGILSIVASCLLALDFLPLLRSHFLRNSHEEEYASHQLVKHELRHLLPLVKYEPHLLLLQVKCGIILLHSLNLHFLQQFLEQH